MNKEKQVYTEPYNVDELRKFYAESAEYLYAIRGLKKLNNSITREVKNMKVH